MKIATWNVNGIRARAAQVCEWLVGKWRGLDEIDELARRHGIS